MVMVSYKATDGSSSQEQKLWDMTLTFYMCCTFCMYCMYCKISFN